MFSPWQKPGSLDRKLLFRLRGVALGVVDVNLGSEKPFRHGEEMVISWVLVETLVEFNGDLSGFSGDLMGF
jgi:hypothetical protein